MTLAISVLCAAWLSVLTVTLVAAVRQISALQLAIQQRDSRGFNVDDDGPVLGSHLPDFVRELLVTKLPDESAVAILLIMSSTCGQCREVIEAFDRLVLPRRQTTIALIAGDGDLAAEIADLAATKFDHAIYGGTAQDFASLLHVSSSPFGILVSADTVLAKSYIRGVGDISNLGTLSNQPVELIS